MPERPPGTVVAPPEPIIRPGYTLATGTDKISSIARPPSLSGWLDSGGRPINLYCLERSLCQTKYLSTAWLWPSRASGGAPRSSSETLSTSTL